MIQLHPYCVRHDFLVPGAEWAWAGPQVHTCAAACLRRRRVPASSQGEDDVTVPGGQVHAAGLPAQHAGVRSLRRPCHHRLAPETARRRHRGQLPSSECRPTPTSAECKDPPTPHDSEVVSEELGSFGAVSGLGVNRDKTCALDESEDWLELQRTMQG